jgi:5-methylcytosine-specific restriction enzyme A
MYPARTELDKLLGGGYLSPSEVEASEDGISEGARTSVLVNVYERNREARRRCIDLFGKACYVCGFDFQQKYGDIGTGFIEVHHLIPLHKTGKEYRVNPERDLRPVCPNCHAMLHRGNPLLTIEQLKSRMS